MSLLLQEIGKSCLARHILGWTQEEIGKVVGMTQGRVAQIINNVDSTKLIMRCKIISSKDGCDLASQSGQGRGSAFGYLGGEG